MKHNIIKADSNVDTNQNLLLAADSSGTVLSKPVSQDAEPAHLNKENLHEPVTNVGTPLQNDCWIYRIVVSALALIILSCIGSAVWLQSQDKEIPEIFIGLGTGALGGLAGLLAPTSSKE
ncbi:hypothetical protein [Nostoc sp. DedQUE07]|uniref:hypothetical protein n=1 Tax=unclassified Nostoc TaxID=2593658 RepID=UPI002AD5AAF0|nr:hypothetical protein [Nostoc sp. DedQUE07]MDZ8130028.1 hypothetical protein [Nostoc sp. DedQUE07]